MKTLTFSGSDCPSIKNATFDDGHKYESYCKCQRCKEATGEFERSHSEAQASAEAQLSACPFCGSEAGIQYEGVVHLLVNDGFPSNGVWVECNSCGCQLGRGGMTSQEDDMGSYDSWEEAIDAWNRRA